MASADDDLLQSYINRDAASAPAPTAARPQPGVTFAPAVAPAPPPIAPQADDLLQSYVDRDKAQIAPVAAAPAPVPANPSPSGPLTNAPTDSDTIAVGKNLATGAIKGAGDIAGFVGNTGNLADYLVARADNAITGKPVQQNIAELQASRQPQPADTYLHRLVLALDPRNVFPSGLDVSNAIFRQLGQYVPTTEEGRVAQGAMEAGVGAASPGVMSGAGGVGTDALIAALRNVPSAAASGGAGTFVTNRTGDPLLGMAAVAAPAAASGSIDALARNLVGQVDPATAALAQTARDQFGVPVTAPQISNSPALKFGSSALDRLPFSGAGGTAHDQQTAFNRSVAATFGENADLITPQVMQNAKTRLGNTFDAIAQQTTIRPDSQFSSDLQSTMADASRVLPQSEVRPLATQVQNLVGVIRQNNGMIPGDAYQALTRKGAPLDRAMSSSDPNVSYYADQIRGAIDDAMMRSAPPDVADSLRTARSQYKAMKTIEDLVEKSPTGNISPALLMGAVRGSYGNMAYNGGGDLGDLARIGQRFLKEPPSSGTAERTSALNLAAKVGGLAGGAMGLNSAYQASPMAAVGGLAGIPLSLGAARIAGGALRSDYLANALINRSLGAPPPFSPNQALVNRLMFPYVPQAVTPQVAKSQ